MTWEKRFAMCDLRCSSCEGRFCRCVCAVPSLLIEEDFAGFGRDDALSAASFTDSEGDGCADSVLFVTLYGGGLLLSEYGRL